LLREVNNNNKITTFTRLVGICIRRDVSVARLKYRRARLYTADIL